MVIEQHGGSGSAFVSHFEFMSPSFDIQPIYLINCTKQKAKNQVLKYPKGLLGDNSPQVSFVYKCLVSRGTDSLCSGLSFQESFQSEQPWKLDIVCLSRAKGEFSYWPL